MLRAETRIFPVIARASVEVEGTSLDTWKVEEHRADRTEIPPESAP